MQTKHLQRIWSGTLIASTFGISILGLALFTGAVPHLEALYAIYFGYAVLTVIFLHSAFFSTAIALKSEGKQLSKRTPKYLEYAYAIIISVSLLQIFFMKPRFIDYMTLVWGDEDSMVLEIKDEAQWHFRNCSRPDPFLYTTYFCSELKKIIEANDLKKYIFDNLVSNEDFASHFIRFHMFQYSMWSRESKLIELVQQIQSVQTARSQRDKLEADPTSQNVLSWLGMLLLPIGIALRLVKTSLELFVEMT